DARTASVLCAWAVSLGKTPIQVKDSPGFLVNRILMPYFNEAVGMVREGFFIDRIDEAMRRFGMPMGPLEVLDQVGLDVAADIARCLASVCAGRLEPNAAFEKMRERGWLGVKTDAGFYRYRRGRPRENDDA